jgi:hypothetical protein
MNDQEKKYLREIIERAIADGCLCSVDDGECTTVRRSRDVDQILAALGTTEQDLLILSNNVGNDYVGAIDLVYGNAPDEVVCDYGWGEDHPLREARMKAIVGEYKA